MSIAISAKQRRKMGSYGEDEVPDSKSLEKLQTSIELNGKTLCQCLPKMFQVDL